MCRIRNCNKVEIQIEKLSHCSELPRRVVGGDESMIYYQTFTSLHKREITNVYFEL